MSSAAGDHIFSRRSLHAEKRLGNLWVLAALVGVAATLPLGGAVVCRQTGRALALTPKGTGKG